MGSCAAGDIRALVLPRKAEWSLSGEPKASVNTFLQSYLFICKSFLSIIILVFDILLDLFTLVIMYITSNCLYSIVFHFF